MLLADGYRDRGDRLWWDSRNIRGLPQEKDQIQRAADDYRRALELYQGIAPYGNASASIVRVQQSLESVNFRLRQLEEGGGCGNRSKTGSRPARTYRKEAQTQRSAQRKRDQTGRRRLTAETRRRGGDYRGENETRERGLTGEAQRGARRNQNDPEQVLRRAGAGGGGWAGAVKLAIRWPNRENLCDKPSFLGIAMQKRGDRRRENGISDDGPDFPCASLRLSSAALSSAPPRLRGEPGFSFDFSLRRFSLRLCVR